MELGAEFATRFAFEERGYASRGMVIIGDGFAFGECLKKSIERGLVGDLAIICEANVQTAAPART